MVDRVIAPGSRVRIRAGAAIWGTFPGSRKVARRPYCVTIHDSTSEGYEQYGTPYVTWVGSGGYWHHAALADVEVLEQRVALLQGA